ncbi:amidohydrolase family protein [Pandoraea apista]|uniref:amidohydrolase family protein n=1 Tax=Pandoraea apista TaxID=93218 RepID=UPI002F91FDBB
MPNMPRRALLTLLLWTSAVCAQTPACVGSAAPPYQGPLFDAMAQTDQWLDIDSAVATAKRNGVTGIALFARVHKKQDGRSLVNHAAEKNPGFILVGAPKLFDMRGDLDNSYVSDVLKGVDAHRYTFVGEILYTHGDKSGGEVTASGERYIDPTRAGTSKLISGLQGKSVPVMTHWEVYDWERDRPLFDKLYSTYPDQVFVWPHLGFADAQQATAMLSAHPNVWATLSKKEKAGENLADSDKEDDIGPPVIDACGVLQPDWKAVMIRFQDRLLFATDAHKAGRWSRYADIITRWRAILRQLPPDVAEEIAYRNAAKLYGVAPGSATPAQALH